MSSEARRLDPDGNAEDYAEFYEQVAQLQAEERYYASNSYAVARRAILLELLRPLAAAGRSLLDVGCASGYYSVPFAQSGGTAVGLDIAPTSVALATRRAERQGVGARCAFSTGDVRDLPFPAAQFDVVLATEVLEHIREQRQALAEISRVLKPGGIAMITTPSALEELPLRDRIRLRDVPSVEAHGIRVERLGASSALEKDGVSHEPYFHDAFTPEGLAALLPTDMAVLEVRSLWHRPPGLYELGAIAMRLRRRTEQTATAPGSSVAPDSPPDVVDFPEPDREARAIMAWSALASRVPMVQRVGRGVLLVARKAG